jgi:hypothetical protein
MDELKDLLDGDHEPSLDLCSRIMAAFAKLRNEGSCFGDECDDLAQEVSKRLATIAFRTLSNQSCEESNLLTYRSGIRSLMNLMEANCVPVSQLFLSCVKDSDTVSKIVAADTVGSMSGDIALPSGDRESISCDGACDDGNTQPEEESNVHTVRNSFATLMGDISN